MHYTASPTPLRALPSPSFPPIFCNPPIPPTKGRSGGASHCLCCRRRDRHPSSRPRRRHAKRWRTKLGGDRSCAVNVGVKSGVQGLAVQVQLGGEDSITKYRCVLLASHPNPRAPDPEIGGEGSRPGTDVNNAGSVPPPYATRLPRVVPPPATVGDGGSPSVCCRGGLGPPHRRVTVTRRPRVTERAVSCSPSTVVETLTRKQGKGGT